MNLSQRFSTIIIESELNKRTFIVFAVLLTALGILSAIQPSYTLIAFGGATALLFTILKPKEAFLATGIFLIFQAAIVRNMTVLGSPEEITNLLNRTDEVIWAYFICYILLHNYKGEIWRFEKTNLEFIAIAFAFIGLLSTFFNHNSVLWASVSIFLALKGFFIYWISRNLSLDEYKIKLFFKIIIYILVLTAIIGILQYFGVRIFTLSSDERLGVRVTRSIFAHHGIFGSLMAVGIALSVGLKLGTKKNKWLYIAFIMAFGLLASTVRRNVLGITFGILFVMLFYRKFRIPKKYIYYFLIIFVFIFAIFSGRFSNIIESTQEEYGIAVHPRYFLYYGAYEIAKNKPLLGEGPGTYGSYISIISKSKIYQKYGIIVEDNYKMDAFWAMIVGEYGIAGAILYLLLLFTLFRTLLNSFPKNDNKPFIKGLYIGYLVFFINFLFESLLSASFSKSLFAFIFFAGIGLLTGIKNKPTEEIH
jgi:O-antigen ligase